MNILRSKFAALKNQKNGRGVYRKYLPVMLATILKDACDNRIIIDNYTDKNVLNMVRILKILKIVYNNNNFHDRYLILAKKKFIIVEHLLIILVAKLFQLIN